MKSKLLIFGFIFVDVILLLYVLTNGRNLQLFNPAGVIAEGESNLILLEIIIMLFVALPVLATLFYTAAKYKEGNSKAKYNPDEKHNIFSEIIWWVIPGLTVGILAILMIRATYKYDPYNKIQSDTAPLKIQVVSLRWKWLFIYPEQNIATVNYLAFPVNTPITFQLTSDAPMNSFWIPQLSGQIYSMSGMSTQTHMEATKIGDYPGSAAEISGQGFSGMRFNTHVTNQADFDSWVDHVKNTYGVLDKTTYNKLSAPSENNPPSFYGSVADNLFNTIMDKYMGPAKVKMEH